VAETAKELGMSTGTVYGLCADRKLRHERHGFGPGRFKIPADALEKYRRSVTVEARPVVVSYYAWRDSNPQPTAP
jgi:excisionase family DNA binding protein